MALIDPRNTLGRKAKGTIVYSGGVQPTDGDTIKIDNVTFEFDTNNSITAGNVPVGISDTVANTWAAFRDQVNRRVFNANATLDVDTNRLYIEALDFGAKGNNIVFTKVAGGAYYYLDGSGYLGGSVTGYGTPIYLANNTSIQLATSSPTGQFCCRCCANHGYHRIYRGKDRRILLQ